MKKVFIIHEFNGSPNSSWIPWLLSELKKEGIYASALTLPTPGTPKLDQWLDEIDRHVSYNPDDEIYLVGFSIGVAAVLKFLEKFFLLSSDPLMLLKLTD